MNIRISRALILTARVALVSAAASLSFGCAVVKINKDETDTVVHSGGEEKGKELAALACRKAGANGSEVISTVLRDQAENAKEGEGRWVTTFKCLY